MCAIIETPAGVIMEAEKLEAACDTNDDGYGVMYVDPETGILVAEQFLFATGAEQAKHLIEKMAQLENVHAVFHVRYGTHGTRSLENTHPFKVVSKEECGRDIWLMHNGVINITSDDPADKDKSDTRIFAEYILRPMLLAAPGLMMLHAFNQLVQEYCTGSRLLLMNDLGQVARVGEWQKNGKCVVSNNSYFHKTYSTNTRNWGQYYGWGSEGSFDSEYGSGNNTTPVIGGTPGVQDWFTKNKRNLEEPKTDLEKLREEESKELKERATNGDTMVVPLKEEPKETVRSYLLVEVGRRMKRTDELEVQDLFEMTEEQISDFAWTDPQALAELIMELREDDDPSEDSEEYQKLYKQWNS
jgi:predicted glutamine amidotransferase